MELRLVAGLLLCGVLFGAASPKVAYADIPGPRPECATEGLGCEKCWQHYGEGEDEKAAFEACAAPLREKGFQEGCRHRQGAGDAVFFCPKGVRPETIITGGGGCASCTLSTDQHLDLVGAAAALGLYLVSHGRRKRCSVPPREK